MKKISNKDYWNYDYINLAVKTKNVEEVTSAYHSFGWEKTHQNSDRRYHDVKHLSFKRKRKIKNKDGLHYLQVAYENLLNKRTDFEYRKNTKSNFFLVIGLMVCISLIVFTCLVFFNTQNSLTKIISVFVGVFVVIVAILFVLMTKRMRKKENEAFKQTALNINQKIDKILSEVKKLRGSEVEE